MPDDEQDADQSDAEVEQDESEEELDVSQERRFGDRKSSRMRTHATAFGFQLDSSAIALSEDSVSEL